MIFLQTSCYIAYKEAARIFPFFWSNSTKIIIPGTKVLRIGEGSWVDEERQMTPGRTCYGKA